MKSKFSEDNPMNNYQSQFNQPSFNANTKLQFNVKQPPETPPSISVIPTEFVNPVKEVERLVERLNNREKFIISYCIHALSNIHNTQKWHIDLSFIDNNCLTQNLSWMFNNHKEEYRFLIDNYKHYLINDHHYKALKSDNAFLLYTWHILVAPYLGLGFDQYRHHSITDSLADNIIYSIDILHDNPVASSSLLETLKSLDAKLKAQTKHKALLSKRLESFYETNKLDLVNETWLKKFEIDDLNWCHEYIQKQPTLTMMGTQLLPQQNEMLNVPVSRHVSEEMPSIEGQLLQGYHSQPMQYSWNTPMPIQQPVQMQWQIFNPLLLPYEYKMSSENKDSLLEFILSKMALMGNSHYRQNYIEKLRKSMAQKRYRDNRKNTEIIDVILKKNAVRKLDYLAKEWRMNRIQALEKLIEFGHENDSLFDD